MGHSMEHTDGSENGVAPPAARLAVPLVRVDTGELGRELLMAVSRVGVDGNAAVSRVLAAGALSLCATAHPRSSTSVHTTFATIFGASISETTMRPDPRSVVFWRRAPTRTPGSPAGCAVGRNTHGARRVHLTPWASSYAPSYRVYGVF
jgi:hypothetical protein